jgi:hypothetical protein
MGFGTAALFAVGWTYALIVAWDDNADQVAWPLIFIAILVGVGLRARRQRQANNRISSNGNG